MTAEAEIGAGLVMEGTVRASASAYGDSVAFTERKRGRLETAVTAGDADSPLARRELYWAGVLRELVAVTVRADPGSPGKPLRDGQGRMVITRYEMTDPRPIAEKVAGMDDWHEILADLQGLMRLRVLSPHPREMSRASLEFVDAHEVIIWEDGSINTIEHSAAGVTGAFREQRMLAPLAGVEQLLAHEEPGAYGEPRKDGASATATGSPDPGSRDLSREDGLINYGALQHVLERIVRPAAGNAPPTHRAAARRTLLNPALELAARARAELGRMVRGG